MRKLLFILCIFTYSLYIKAQSMNEAPNFEKYAEANEVHKKNIKEHTVVFLGNSITEGWVKHSPDFFIKNNYIGRGISSQTSLQLLLRFRRDVVELKPEVVVINTGINDIGSNTGPYNSVLTLDNIKSMAEIARYNNIKVILTSVLPATSIWNPTIKNLPYEIDTLNKEIKSYAEKEGFAYIDYNTRMRNINGKIIESLAYDGIHPNLKGYRVMESVAKKVIDKVILNL